MHGANVHLLGISLSRGRVTALDSNKAEFKGFASPFRVAARSLGHCSPRVAQRIRGKHLSWSAPSSCLRRQSLHCTPRELSRTRVVNGSAGLARSLT